MALKSPVTGTDWTNRGSSVKSQPEKPSPGPNPKPKKPDNDYRGFQFDSILHAVDDLGWDNNGNEVIDLPQDNNTLIKVPNGDYLIDRNVFYGVSNWGLYGMGDNVTFLPKVGKCIRAIQCSTNDLSENLLLENIQFHQREGLEAGIELSLNVTDGLEVHNCERSGVTPNRRTAGPPYGYEPNGISVSIKDHDGSGLIKEWKDHSTTEVVDYPENSQGIFAGWSCRGTLTVKYCDIQNQGEHALYGSKAWNVHVEGGTYKNNVNTNMRVAGPGSYVEGASIGYDGDTEYTVAAGSGDKKATRIYRWENSRKGITGGEIRNCEIFCETDGLLGNSLLHIMGNSGGITIRNTTFRNNSDAEWVRVDEVGSGWRGYEPDEEWVRLIDCTFTGSNENEPIRDDRDAVEFEGCDFDIPEASTTDASSSLEWLYNYVYN